MLTSNLASLCMSGSIFDGGTAGEHQSKGDQTRRQTLFAINVARFREQPPTLAIVVSLGTCAATIAGHLILPKLRALAAGVRSASSTVLLMGAEDNKMDVSSRAAGQPAEPNGLRHARGCFAAPGYTFPSWALTSPACPPLRGPVASASPRTMRRSADGARACLHRRRLALAGRGASR